ncbi:MAG: hypothetical protein JO305_00815 [Alphaproteobacteria bacterium]|nr:hypothetical protein [Alphaproteobacteria bacterium]
MSWLPVAGALSYRLSQRDLDTGDHRSVYYGEIPNCTVAADKIEPGRRHAYRVEVLVEGAPDYATLVPYMTIEPEPADALVLEAPGHDHQQIPAWRLYMRDDVADKVVVDRVSVSPRFAVDRSSWPASHRLRYRFYRWNWPAKRWDDLGGYRDAPYKPIASARAGRRRQQQAGPGLVALITIDTEASLRLMRHPDLARAIEHQVCGRIDGREIGIGLIMDQLERHNCRGTFFVDVMLEHQFGQAALETTIAAIAARGHDIQLHMHPSPNLVYTGDERLVTLARNSVEPDGFARCLDMAMELFVARVGRTPIAFRNGSYRIFDSYFEILKRAGFRYDSSVYPFKNCHVSSWMRGRTQPFEVIPGLWEIPVSWVVSRPEGEDDHALVSQFTTKQGSTRTALEQSLEILAHTSSPRPCFIVGMLHSYSYLGEFRARDEAVAAAWNREHAQLVPAELHSLLKRGLNNECLYLEGVYDARIASIEGQLQTLAAMSEAEVVTFDMLAQRHEALLPSGPWVIEPLAEFDRGARQTRLTAVRRYSRDYLSHLERTAEPAGAALAG